MYGPRSPTPLCLGAVCSGLECCLLWPEVTLGVPLLTPRERRQAGAFAGGGLRYDDRRGYDTSLSIDYPSTRIRCTLRWGFATCCGKMKGYDCSCLPPMAVLRSSFVCWERVVWGVVTILPPRRSLTRPVRSSFVLYLFVCRDERFCCV